MTKDYGYSVDRKYKPKSSIMIDAQNGQILWQDNPDEIRDQGSMAKAMTMFIVYEAMSEGKFGMDTLITATSTDQQISQVYEVSNTPIVEGVKYPVSELIKMSFIPSSSASTIMLANLVSDNDAGKFIDIMNEKAKEIGMTNTHFNNCSGAQAAVFKGLYTPEGYNPNESNQTTARDYSILGFNIVNKHPEILEITKNAKLTIMQGTPYEENVQNYNYSLPGNIAPNGQSYSYEGVDGIKTGSSPIADYNYMATCKKNDMRVVEVIMGVGNWDDEDSEFNRHLYGNALLDYAYSNFSKEVILPAGKHDIDSEKVKTDDDLVAVKPKDIDGKFSISGEDIIYNSPLPFVTKSIPQIKVAYKKAGLLSFSKRASNDKKSTSKNSGFSHFIKTSFLIFILLLFCLLTPNRIKNHKKSKFIISLKIFSLLSIVYLVLSMIINIF
ncbi:hypothetical protein BG261_02185 [Floricoccus tropicus]|uniref:Peptidase S11 D-alanyl-D-alanine carboxypeptidase A N-terminal domain-containing protein n=2 Tax=Floricoccus tropicus TaxID=1859473 RepID=A0A1E8GNV0_9LACT|nr:hypothetical protein BG261_02185 [Floricoccus tropicus]